MQKTILRTVLGDISPDNLDLILPHEHLFTDLRGPAVDDYAQADPKDVLSVMLPLLKDAQKAGVTALVECSTIGVGRNIDVLQTLAERTRVHIIAPTGLYRDEYIPAIYRDQTIKEIAALFTLELTKGIGESRSKAGFIKIALSDDGPRPIEERNIRAAARTSKTTGAAIASHTIGGRAAMEEIDILQDEGFDLNKFIWVHAGSEPDVSIPIRAASLGANVEFDSIGNPDSDQDTVDAVLAMLNEGFGDRILLSHDAGWFQPGHPGGEPDHGFRDFTALTKHFLPRLRENGVDEHTIQLITKENPKRVFAMRV